MNWFVAASYVFFLVSKSEMGPLFVEMSVHFRENDAINHGMEHLWGVNHIVVGQNTYRKGGAPSCIVRLQAHLGMDTSWYIHHKLYI